ncbi:TolC family protein [Pseudemcibacter aquimaris]|uniref:TolC family protein n=1 Tax=Pseudemcibacter aquimaris TaxID=2857064 RepID=UPI002012B7F3|nr:TolC family protein [Pseudemcibacter aquimaris]MCC3861257.1 TolC family protein [Pseudemcibacter aquimaris]WDU58031.1 TolC family protein [Pseudemcibacter aquimaris]
MTKINWGIGVLALSMALSAPIAVKAQESSNFVGVPAYSQTFKENIQLAVSEHPRTSAALAVRDEQKFREDEARSALYPTIGLDVSGRHRIFDNFEDRFDNITQRSLRDTAANVALVGRQLLYDGGSTFSRISSARHAFTAAHEEYSLEASAVALAAVEAHYQVLFQRMRKDFHQQNVARHREILDMVNQRFESGRGANQDVTLMESRLALAETQASRADMDLEEATSHYEEVYNFSPANLDRPEFALNLPATENEALEMGFMNSPLLTMASSRTMASKEDVNAVKKERLPYVSLELAATKYDVERWTPDYDVSGRLILNYDLYTGGANTARIARSQKNYERSRHAEDQIGREVNRGIKVSFQSMQSQQRQVVSLEKAMQASGINRDQTREQFEVTGGSLFSLLEAEKEHHNAREQHLSGMIEHDLSKYRLLDSMGTLLPALNIILQRGE